jgi:para-nitrobenzyl esterase
VSPLSRDLIAGAIGESGSLIATLPPRPVAETEKAGVEFATKIGAASLAALRALSAQQLLDEVGKLPRGSIRFSANLDGHFMPKAPEAVYAAGEEAHVPLLAGWNSEEMNARAVLGPGEPTPEAYGKAVRSLYGERADEVLKAYPGTTADEVLASATDLAGDRFIAFGTWRWLDLHATTSTRPTYRYYFARPRPPMRPEMGDAVAGLAGGVIRGPEARANAMPPARGAVHSAEIEYALGNLATNKVYAWTPEDFAVSKLMQEYFAQFIKTGNPNGPGLPKWPAVESGGPAQVMRIDVESRADLERHRDRYLLLQSLVK